MNFGSLGATVDTTYRQAKKPKYENAGSETAFISIDDALDYAGDNSSYQKRVNNIFSIQYAIYSFLLMGFPLLLVKPTFICPDGNPCKEKDACALGNYTIQSNGEETITTEFELYCDRSYISGMLGSILFLGSVFAFGLFPQIGNSRGRKFGIVLANIMSGVSALVIGLSPNVYLIMGFLVIGGFAFGGFETLCLTYTSEVSGERFRNISSVTLGTVWAVAQIFAAPLFLVSGSWRIIFVAYMAVPMIISLWPNIVLVYETPRFLNSKKKFAKAREVINKICEINHRRPFKAKLYGEIEYENAKATTFFAPRQPPRETIRPNQSFPGYKDLFGKELRKTTLVLLYIWFFRNFAYFGLNYSLPVLGTEVYQNFTLTAFAETFANLLAGKIKFTVGRIKSLYMSIILVSLSCLLIWFVPIPQECYLDQGTCYQKTLSVTLAVIAKFSIGLFANILVTYTTENYPTDIRSLGLALNFSVSRIGVVAMPFILTIMQDHNVSPLILFGIMGIVAFILIIWLLPETYGMVMTEFMVELQRRDEPLQPLLPLLRNHDNEDSIL